MRLVFFEIWLNEFMKYVLVIKVYKGQIWFKFKKFKVLLIII